MSTDAMNESDERRMPSRPTRRGLPEYMTYEDTGCELSSTCMECPLAMCKYDDPEWRKHNDLSQRDNEIVSQRERGIKVDRIAASVGVSSRTVYRVLQRRAESDVKGDVYDAATVSVSLEELGKWSPVKLYNRDVSGPSGLADVRVEYAKEDLYVAQGNLV